MFTVWCLKCVPNLVQISVIGNEIDALCHRHSSDDVTWINFRFRLLVTWSSSHGRDASSNKFGAGIFTKSEVIDIFP